MSKALPGEHYCKNHQGNHSHYAPHNCTVCTQATEIERLRAELAEWRKDAERYRWLRGKCRDGSLTIARADDWSLHPWSGDDIDKEIAAARKGEGG